MLSKRVVVVSSDPAFGKRFAPGLMAAGASLEMHASPTELVRPENEMDLLVVHVSNDDEKGWIGAVGPKVPAGTPVLALLPRPSVSDMVDMHMGGRVTASLVTDQLESWHLSAIATRLLYGDIFGLEKVMPWGVRIYSHLVGDYQEKSVAISGISDYAASIGVRRKYREPMEQCLDEMLMNALYDAPVDAEGKQLFADIPTKTRISLRMEQKAIVQYACDGRLFAISVRDSFGALEPQTVVRYLDKCLHAKQQIDRKTGGAGLGLYIIANAATQFFVNVFPGVATEVVCTFDLTAAKVQLREFGLFKERIDSSGRLVAGGPSRLLSSLPTQAVPKFAAAPSNRGVIAALAASIVLLLALIAMVAVPRYSQPPRGGVRIVTDPPGAQIEIDGRTIGTTGTAPLEQGALEAGRAHKITARLEGYSNAEEIVVPPEGSTAAVQLRLIALAPQLTFESDPSGVSVSSDGRVLGTTPFTTDTLKPPGGEVTLAFEKTGFRRVERAVKIPGPGKQASVLTQLTMAADVGSLKLTTEPPGAQVYVDGNLIAGEKTPVLEHLAQGGEEHVITFVLAGHQPATQRVRLPAGARDIPVKATLVTGGGISVDVNLPQASITIVGSSCKEQAPPATHCAVPNGRHKVTVSSSTPYLRESREIAVNGTHERWDLNVGFVQAAPRTRIVLSDGPKDGVTRMALPEGSQKVTLRGEDGKTVQKTVRVQADKTTTVRP